VNTRTRQSFSAILLAPSLTLICSGQLPNVQAAPTTAAISTTPASSAPPTAVTAYPAPPPGFDPLTATTAQLQEYGFPLPPSGTSLLQAWTTAMMAAVLYVPPVTTPSATLHKMPGLKSGDTDHTVEYANNWAGHIIPQSDYANESFTESSSTWTQPGVPGNSSYSNYQSAPDASFWNGLGALNLIQAGADSISTKTPTYKFWVEDYPQGTDWESNPAIAAGNIAYVSVEYEGSNKSDIFLENETSGNYTTISLATPDVGNTAANFINERLGNYYLPNYGSTNLLYCAAIVGGANISLNSAYNNIIYMTSDGSSSGTPLASPGSVNNSTGSFSVTWKGAGP
jgi:hypothetical protein